MLATLLLVKHMAKGTKKRSAAEGSVAKRAAKRLRLPSLATMRRELCDRVGEDGRDSIPTAPKALRQMYRQLQAEAAQEAAVEPEEPEGSEATTPSTAGEPAVAEAIAKEDAEGEETTGEGSRSGGGLTKLRLPLKNPQASHSSAGTRTEPTAAKTGKLKGRASSTASTSKSEHTSVKSSGSAVQSLRKRTRGRRRKDKRTKTRRARARADTGVDVVFSEDSSLDSLSENGSDVEGMIRGGTSRRYISAREKEEIERDVEVKASLAVLQPMLGNLYPEAKLTPRSYKYPLPVKNRVLPNAVVECLSNGRTVEAETRYQLGVVSRSQGVKASTVREVEPMLVQSAICIDINIREEGIKAVVNPGLEVLYRVMYSTLAQIANQTSAGVARRVEAFPTHRVGLPLDRAERREAQKADKQEGVAKAKE